MIWGGGGQGEGGQGEGELSYLDLTGMCCQIWHPTLKLYESPTFLVKPLNTLLHVVDLLRGVVGI